MSGCSPLPTWNDDGAGVTPKPPPASAAPGSASAASRAIMRRRTCTAAHANRSPAEAPIRTLHDRLPGLMSLVVVGSIAFDSVKTPFGERERMLGGSAVHFSLAASFFTEVRVVGPVGDDFGDDEYEVLKKRGINTDEIERVEGGKTFFWSGNYQYDLNTAHTNETELNVFGEFQPKLSSPSKDTDTLFL